MMAILALPMAAGFSFIISHSSILVARMIAGLVIGLNIILMNGYWIGAVPFDGPTVDDLLNLPQRYREVFSQRVFQR
jgi:hypothetical protein